MKGNHDLLGFNLFWSDCSSGVNNLSKSFIFGDFPGSISMFFQGFKEDDYATLSNSTWGTMAGFILASTKLLWGESQACA
jgi:hypothetical protein